MLLTRCRYHSKSRLEVQYSVLQSTLSNKTVILWPEVDWISTAFLFLYIAEFHHTKYASNPYNRWCIIGEMSRKNKRAFCGLKSKIYWCHLWLVSFGSDQLHWGRDRTAGEIIPEGPINNVPAMFQTMAWRRSCDSPLSELMMICLLPFICITRPQLAHSGLCHELIPDCRHTSIVLFIEFIFQIWSSIIDYNFVQQL